MRGLPDGSIWNQQAGKFRWEPTIEDAGEHVVRFSAQRFVTTDKRRLRVARAGHQRDCAGHAPPQFTSAPPAASVAQGTCSPMSSSP